MAEAELTARIKSGDRDAFNELVREYESRVINAAYGMLSDKEDAYDAAQEVFIRVYKSIDSFKGQSSLTTWIYRITVNICNDILRKRQRSAKTISITQDENEGENTQVLEIADSAPTPEEAAEQSEAQKALMAAIADLSTDYKNVIMLCDLQGMSYDETSKILKIPTGTVKSRLNRARNALRKKLMEKRELFR